MTVSNAFVRFDRRRPPVAVADAPGLFIRSRHAQFDPDRGQASAWLLAITADQARKANRRRRPASHLISVSSTVRDADEKVDLDYALARLPVRQREAIECFYFVGLSVTETAAVMRCAEGTVKSTLSDARQRLRDLLRSQE